MPPRPIEEIEAELQRLKEQSAETEKRIAQLTKEVAAAMKKKAEQN
jgi:chaperonin cofactor prefoldin